MLFNNSQCPVEEILADCLSPLIRELRMIDVSDYLGYLHFDALDSLGALVRDAAEPYFSPGFVTLSFMENSGSGWGELPSIRLYMSINGTFAKHTVSVVLRDSYAEIKLLHSIPEAETKGYEIWQRMCIDEIINNRYPYGSVLLKKPKNFAIELPFEQMHRLH